MVQPSQSSSNLSAAIPEYEVQGRNLRPKNSEEVAQEAVTIEDTISDFVLEEIFSKFFDSDPSEGMKAIQASGLVCKRWHRVVSNVFLKDPRAAIPVIQHLFVRLRFDSDMALPNLPPHILQNPIIGDMWTKKSSFIQGLLQVLENDISPTCERTCLITQAFLEAHMHREVPFLFGTEEIRNNKKIVLLAVQNHCRTILCAPIRFRDDKDVLIAAVRHHGRALEFASSRLKDDRDVVMEAVRNDGHALGYGSIRLRNDKDVVMEAVKNNGLALGYAAFDLQNDKDIVMAAVRQEGCALARASYMQDDIDVVMAAVKNNGLALNFASPRFQDDKEVVLTAVRNHGTALEFASPRLRHDIDIVWAAVAQNRKALAFAVAQLTTVEA